MKKKVRTIIYIVLAVFLAVFVAGCIGKSVKAKYITGIGQTFDILVHPTKPIFASEQDWYRGTTDKSDITVIRFASPSNTPAEYAESFFADAKNIGSIKCYLTENAGEKELYIISNGYSESQDKKDENVIHANANASEMFKDFSALKAIYDYSNLFDTAPITSSTGMFSECESLKGGAGTIYDSSHTDAAYARTDTTNKPGYITRKTVKITFDPNSGSGTMPEQYILPDVEDKLIPEEKTDGTHHFTKANAFFVGWNDKPDGTGRSFADGDKLNYIIKTDDGEEKMNVIEEDTILYAQWDSECILLPSAGTSINDSQFKQELNKLPALSNIASITSFLRDASAEMPDIIKNGDYGTDYVIISVSKDFRQVYAYVGGSSGADDTLPVRYWSAEEKIYTNPSCNGMFANFKSLAETDVGDLDTSKTTTFASMFEQCESLTSLDLQKWNTSSATAMNRMFFGSGWATPTGFETLDLTGWDVSNVLTMAQMFRNSTKLTTVKGFEGWNTSSVISMTEMFYQTMALTTDSIAGISEWDVSNVETFANMFRWDTFESIDLSKWRPVNCISTHSMFLGCIELTELDLSSWEMPKLINSGLMFRTYIQPDQRHGGHSKLKIISLPKCTSGSLVYMNEMFDSLENLETVNGCENWNTSHVINMDNSFNGCNKLSNLNTSNWDTGYCIWMTNMFRNCHELDSLDTSGWNLSNVKDMDSMFLNCYALTALDMSGGNPAKCTSTEDMFNNCTSLKTFDATGWCLSSCTNTANMFNNCSLLTEIEGTATWNLANDETMRNMFNNCSALNGLDTSDWDISKVRDMSNTFNECESLAVLDTSKWDITNVEDMHCMFSNCSSLTELDMSGGNPEKCVYINNMFSSCTALKSLNTTGWTLKSCTGTNEMFANCTSLTEIKGTKTWNLTNNKNMQRMFLNCHKLNGLETEDWDTSKVTSMSETFRECNSLTYLDVSRWNTGSCTSMAAMFCASAWQNPVPINNMDVSKWDTSKVTSMSEMFRNCEKLTSIDVSGWDTGNVKTFYMMFYQTEHLLVDQKMDLSKWNTSKATSFNNMFRWCNFKELDLSGWDTSAATDMAYIFFACTHLETIYASEQFVTSQLSNEGGKSMFEYSLSKLKGGNGTTWSGSHINKEYARIDNPPDAPGYFTYKDPDSDAAVFFDMNYPGGKTQKVSSILPE